MSKLTPEEVEQYKRDNPLVVRFVSDEEWPTEVAGSAAETGVSCALGGAAISEREGDECAPRGCLHVAIDSTLMTPREWRRFSQFITQWLDERYPE